MEPITILLGSLPLIRQINGKRQIAISVICLKTDEKSGKPWLGFGVLLPNQDAMIIYNTAGTNIIATWRAWRLLSETVQRGSPCIDQSLLQLCWQIMITATETKNIAGLFDSVAIATIKKSVPDQSDITTMVDIMEKNKIQPNCGEIRLENINGRLSYPVLIKYL